MKKAVMKVLAVMLILVFAAAMIPAASAAGETLVVKNESADFSFDLYQIAKLDVTNGKYTATGTVDSTIMTAINTANQSGAAFLAAIDAVSDTSKLGSFVVNLTAKNGGTTSKSLTEPGIYYARVKDKPQNADQISKVSNSVIVWPEYSDGWQYYQTDGKYVVDLGTKVGTDKITKYFSEDETKEYKTAGQDDEINFTLRADVVGSATDKLDSYMIWDKMCPGLKYKEGSIDIKYDATVDANADFEVVTSTLGTESDSKYTGGTYFEIKAKSATLSGAAFYSHREVYVTYTATVLNAAGIGKDYNPNKDGLVYKFPGKDAVDRDGREVKVYTFAAKATKIDATATAKAADKKNVMLDGAVLGLYTKDAENKLTEIARGTSVNGLVEFKRDGDAKAHRLAPGSYIVKEISAPQGYALSTVEYPLTIADSDAARAGDGFFAPDGDKVVENFATKLPATGGHGTWMFTLIGAGMILIAAVMLVLVLRKRTAK